jgi:hypothetical protein
LAGALVAFLAVQFGQGWLYGSPLGGILLIVGVWMGLCALGLVAAGVSLARGERPRWVASLGLFVNGVAVFAPLVWHSLAP